MRRPAEEAARRARDGSKVPMLADALVIVKGSQFAELAQESNWLGPSTLVIDRAVLLSFSTRCGEELGNSNYSIANHGLIGRFELHFFGGPLRCREMFLMFGARLPLPPAGRCRGLEHSLVHDTSLSLEGPEGGLRHRIWWDEM